VTEDDIPEKSNDIIMRKQEKTLKTSFEYPKACRCLRAAMQGRTLLQRIIEEKIHD
tara:strand:+ start:247 stop:414 length:168 start_codon:yes stop_codon:yes gene_type:complete